MTGLLEKTAKSHKGRLVLESRKPKAAEVARKILLIRGTKVSEPTRQALAFLVCSKAKAQPSLLDLAAEEV